MLNGEQNFLPKLCVPVVSLSTSASVVSNSGAAAVVVTSSVRKVKSKGAVGVVVASSVGKAKSMGVVGVVVASSVGNVKSIGMVVEGVIFVGGSNKISKEKQSSYLRMKQKRTHLRVPLWTHFQPRRK